MDYDQLRRLVAEIPTGGWAGYLDLAAACGGSRAHARTFNQRFLREAWPGAHRVLRSDGTIAATALGDPVAVKALLEREGVVFDGPRADPEQRWRPPVPAGAETAAPAAG
jgi:alkylated DNA nucleotide flippase Atl1